jgi:hypothetical protein
MARKTQGVYDLVAEILGTMPAPYGEDVIEDVCVAIETSPGLFVRYQGLCEDLRQWVVNNWIGKYVKERTGKTTIREVQAKKAKIITAYTKLAS